MASGLKALHDIDRAISKARRTVSDASDLPRRASSALAQVSRKQAAAYGDIAKLRLELIEEGDGGALGYVDRQAEKLLALHEKQEARLIDKAQVSLAKISTLEADRRSQEKIVAKAVESYDKRAEICQNKLVSDPEYITLLTIVETAEATTQRAQAKQNLAEEEVEEKGAPYRNDPYFQYLQSRKYGTREAKGWFFTKMFDAILARRGKYRDAALNYKRLMDIPVRLAGHVKLLEGKEEAAREALKQAEETALVREGVTKLKEESLVQQSILEKIDISLEAQEELHQSIRTEQTQVSAGESAPYKEAIDLLVNTLERKKMPDLRRLAAQTVSQDDDRAIERIIELDRHAKELEEDQQSARSIIKKYQGTLGDLERLRQRFKVSRYDAPSSTFPSGRLIGTLLGQLLAGMVSGNDVWRQIERAQRTVRRHSDMDFGGIDWTEAMRLPRNSGGFGGSRRRRSTPRRRAPQRRAPRVRMPRSSGGRKGGGGFHTKGGF